MDLMSPSPKWYKDKWDSCLINEEHRPRINAWVDRLLVGQIQYQSVEKLVQVPWAMIGAIHGLESHFDFDTYLGNGDALNKPTIHIPAGRGPFDSWVDGAVDALKYDGLNNRAWPDIPTQLEWCEKYNGLGYFKHDGHMSPYIWACTNHETCGIYVADGKFNESKFSKEVGVAAVFKWLIEMGVM